MYRHLLIFTLSSIISVWVLSLSTWLLILFGQNTCNILLRHLFWNASHFFMSATVISQHSDPYISIDFTLLLSIFTLVFTLYMMDFHTWFNDRKAFLAFCNLDFMSSPAPSPLVTFDPRYVNSSTSSSSCLSILKGQSNGNLSNIRL